MDESIWVAAQEANPWCLMTLSAFSDWLQERNDPRWEAAALLADLGLVGVKREDVAESSHYNGYIGGAGSGISNRWLWSTFMHTKLGEVSNVWTVDDRYRLLQVWSDWPGLTAEWEAETRRIAGGSGEAR